MNSKENRLRLSREHPETPFAFTAQAAAEEIGFLRWKAKQAQGWAKARRLDERRTAWRWCLESRNQVYSVSGLG
jgi:hypothetical protein